MYIVQYWPDWAGGEIRQFTRDTFAEAYERLCYWLAFDPDMRYVVYEDSARMSRATFEEYIVALGG